MSRRNSLQNQVRLSLIAPQPFPISRIQDKENSKVFHSQCIPIKMPQVFHSHLIIFFVSLRSSLIFTPLICISHCIPPSHSHSPHLPHQLLVWRPPAELTAATTPTSIYRYQTATSQLSALISFSLLLLRGRRLCCCCCCSSSSCCCCRSSREIYYPDSLNLFMAA